MKINTKDPTTVLSRWTRFLGAMLTVAFMVPAAAVSQSLAPVNLGTAGDFVILTKTGISTTGTTSIVGDIGVSPAAATYITGDFALILDPSGTFSTSTLVTGKVYAADYTDPTPAKMTAAVGDMETAYNDAFGRASPPDNTELYTGDLTGRTFTPGVYKWSSGVSVADAGVTISGAANDVWIFQIAGTLTVGNGAKVYLSGAQSKNIFWQVAGEVTLGTTAEMKGIILGQTGIHMITGATLDGRALAQTAVTLQANNVTSPVVTAVEIGLLVPQEFALFQNYPNPFNPTTTIGYVLQEKTSTKITLMNVIGKEVVILVNEEQDKGYHKVDLNANNLPSGVYLYRLQAGNFVETKKLVLMK